MSNQVEDAAKEINELIAILKKDAGFKNDPITAVLLNTAKTNLYIMGMNEKIYDELKKLNKTMSDMNEKNQLFKMN